MNKLLIAPFLLCAICCLLAGCSGIRMNVDSFNNSYLQIAEYKRFSFLASKKVEQAKEQHLFSVVKKELEEKSLVYDDKAPQFLIALNISDETMKERKSNSEKVVSDVTNRVTIVFIDNIYNKQNSGTKIVWQGEASTNSSGPDLNSVDVEKCLVIGILQEYPNKLKSIPKSVNSYWCGK